jgi:drug/metabolite transporter (DMT)-like permease
MTRLLRFLPPILSPAARVEQSGLAHGRAWMVVSALLFGAMAVVTRSACSALPAAQVAVVRFTIGLIAVGGWAIARPRDVRPTNFRLLALRGLIGGIAVLAYFVALGRLNAGLGTLLNNTFPIWAAPIAVLFLGERMTPRIVSGLLVAGVGLGVVLGPMELLGLLHGLSDRRIVIGLGAGLFSGICGGGATVIIRQLRRHDTAVSIFGAFCAGGLLVCLPPALHGWQPIPVSEWGGLVAIGVLSVGGQLTFTYGLKFVPASGSVVNLLTVVVSYALAAIWLKEPVTVHAAAGGALLMLGVYLVSAPEAAPVAEATAAEGA